MTFEQQLALIDQKMDSLSTRHLALVDQIDKSTADFDKWVAEFDRRSRLTGQRITELHTFVEDLRAEIRATGGALTDHINDPGHGPHPH